MQIFEKGGANLRFFTKGGANVKSDFEAKISGVTQLMVKNCLILK